MDKFKHCTGLPGYMEILHFPLSISKIVHPGKMGKLIFHNNQATQAGSVHFPKQSRDC